MYVCLFGCLSVRLHISKSKGPNLHVLTVAVARSSSDDSAINTLCTSGFQDDIMFSHNTANWPESATTCMFRRVCQGGSNGGEVCCLRLHLVRLIFFTRTLISEISQAQMRQSSVTLMNFREANHILWGPTQFFSEVKNPGDHRVGTRPIISCYKFWPLLTGKEQSQ